MGQHTRDFFRSHFSQAQMEALRRFEESPDACVFERCHKTLAERELGGKHFDQMTAAIGAMDEAALTKVFRSIVTRDTAPWNIVAAFSYMDPDPASPAEQDLVGAKSYATSQFIDVMHRPFPLELCLRHLEKQHFDTTHIGLGLQDPYFNLMTAMAILMADTLTDHYEDDQNYCIALPGKHGLFVGYAKPEEASFFTPLRRFIRSRKHPEETDALQALPVETPHFLIILQDFISNETLERQPKTLAIKRALDEMIVNDEQFIEGITTASGCYFSGGIAHAQRIKAQNIHTAVGLGPSNSLDAYMQSKRKLATFMDSDDWQNFAMAHDKYVPPYEPDEEEPPSASAPEARVA